jgi:dihydrolipoamide dehydrogenase
MQDMNSPQHFQIAVIGAGPAGYSAAIRASQLGASVVLIENGPVGGTCLNRGCIPTKFFWTALHLEKKIKRAADYGLAVELKDKNMLQMHQKKDKTLDLLGKSLRRLIDSYKVTILQGNAGFINSTTIAVTDAAGNCTSVEADKIIIAAGSRPKSIPGITIDHQKYIDSNDALAMTEAPRTLLVIGGGAIGIEMAFLFAGFGSEVHLIEREAQLLPGEDTELAEEIKKLLVRQGVRVTTGVTDSTELIASSEKVLVAIGRQPNSDTLGLENTAIQYNNKGILTDDYMQTSVSNIYAAGDVAGKCYLAYTAQYEGIVAAENAMGQKNIPNCSNIPRVVFSNPPAAAVGKKESDFPNDSLLIGRCPISALARASIEGERTGWVKIISDKQTGRILGGSVISPSADELISIIALAVKHSLTLHDLSRDLFFHPSLTEAVYAAVEDANKTSTDLPPRRQPG